MYSWGGNTLGQLGHGDQRIRKLPTQIQSLKRKTITKASIGHNFVVMLGRDVSQAEQQMKKQKRKMQKEAKERERQHRNKQKQDENRKPAEFTQYQDDAMRDDAVMSKDRLSTDYQDQRRESNQPATPKLPGESARDSAEARSGEHFQESHGRSRPKSANHVVRGIIEEMEKISTKGQGLLERVKHLKDSKQDGDIHVDHNEIRSSRPLQRQEDLPSSRRDRSALVEDSRGIKSSHAFGPAKSASFGEAATEVEDDSQKERWIADQRKQTMYVPKSNFMDK